MRKVIEGNIGEELLASGTEFFCVVYVFMMQELGILHFKYPCGETEWLSRTQNSRSTKQYSFIDGEKF